MFFDLNPKGGRIRNFQTPPVPAAVDELSNPDQALVGPCPNTPKDETFEVFRKGNPSCCLIAFNPPRLKVPTDGETSLQY